MGNHFTPFAPYRTDLGTFVKPRPENFNAKFSAIQFALVAVNVACIAVTIMVRM